MRPPRARRRVLLALTITALLLVLAALWVGVRSVMARGELEAARPSAVSAQKALLAGDAEGARVSIDELVQRQMQHDGWLVSNGGPSDLSLA